MFGFFLLDIVSYATVEPSDDAILFVLDSSHTPWQPGGLIISDIIELSTPTYIAFCRICPILLFSLFHLIC
jgi:hypothetical protein